MIEPDGKRSHSISRAEGALHLALQDCGGALDIKNVAMVACYYPVTPQRRDPGPWAMQACWGHRADALVYPASVMKLFVLAALAEFRARGRIDTTREDDRAAAAMIRESSNEATAYLMGRLTGAEDGAPLPPQALHEWIARRSGLQDWYRATGRPEYQGLRLLHATYQDSPYGRAFDARVDGNGNVLSAEAGAALMHDIARGAMQGSAWMMGLLDRTFQRLPGYDNAEADQVRGFLAEGLPADVQVWSKAGHTSKTRHDLLFAEKPDGSAFILSVMTEGKWSADHDRFLPALARHFYATS